MRHATCIGRLGMLAAGMGIGAALASTPGVASADSPTDPLSWIDELLGGLSVSAQTTSPMDMQISINGMDLFPTADNTATATSGTGDIAIAIGDGANATSAGISLGGILPLGNGIGDIVIADGTNSTAEAAVLGGANFDFVFAGANSLANAELGANFDIASAVGTGSQSEVGVGDSFDIASADGTNSSASVGLGNYDLAFANGTDSSATAGVGNGDLATAFGGGDANADGFLATAFANGVNTDANADGVLNSAFASGTNAEANAVNGIGDLASIINTGSAPDIATAGGIDANAFSNNDAAEIIGTGSTAIAGSGGDWDLAAAFGDMLHAIATGSNFLFDILPSL
jgi:hypothetical protein